MTSPAMMPVWMAAPMAIALVGVDRAVGLLAEDLAHDLRDLGGAGLAAHEQDLVDLVRRAGRRRRGSAGRAPSSLQEVVGERLVLLPGEDGVEVLGPGGVGGDEGQHDLRLLRGRELALRLLRRLLQALEGHAVLPEVDARLALELLDQPVDDALVEVLAAQEGVAAGGPHLEEALRHLQDRDVEGAAAEVVDGHELALGVLQAVGEGGRRGLVEDARDLEARDEAGVLGGLALGVVEVGGDGDDRLFHRLAQVVLRRRLQLLQDEGRDLGRRVDLLVDLDVHVAVGRLARAGRGGTAGPAPPRSDSNFRPMRRFTAKTVFLGLVRAWRLAIWPTRRSPLAVKPTMDGVVRAPSWLGMTCGAPPSITATQELVVPRSMPITLPTHVLAVLSRLHCEEPAQCIPSDVSSPSASASFATLTRAGRSSRSLSR